jgi:cytochrome bd-type quinol oxidase subunit 2
VRNRVAHNGVQPLRALLARTAALTFLPAVLLVGAATVASADPQASSEADARISFAIAGPVGIAAIAIGILGVVAGLLRRHRRQAASLRAVAQPPTVTPEPASTSQVA